ncbi:hypothetical protein ACF1BQ_005730 [Bradyrhizobium sp. RDT10]
MVSMAPEEFFHQLERVREISGIERRVDSFPLVSELSSDSDAHSRVHLISKIGIFSAKPFGLMRSTLRNRK